MPDQVASYIKLIAIVLLASNPLASAEVTTAREDATLAFLSHPGIQYSHAINHGGWKASTSVFECRLEHTLPFFGEAVFRTRAGETSVFCLRSRVARYAAGEGNMSIHLPVWKPEESVLDLGGIPVKKGKNPVFLKTKWAEKMLAHLHAGRDISIVHPAWFTIENAPEAEVTISTIGFRKAYRKYLKCTGGLLPANYNQLKRTSLQFPPGLPEDLPRYAVKSLDKILKLVEKDKKIRLFYVDGHTDAMGDRAENLELSKNRAELVKTYLMNRGVPEDWIKVRWHGERYPVASNDTPAGRAKNRRVTVRLEREDKPKKLALGDSAENTSQ